MLLDTSAPAQDVNLVAILKTQGIEATIGYGPTLLHVPAIGGGEILVAVGHNFSGWEAVLEVNDQQQALPDGPESAEASLYDVASWILRLHASVGKARQVQRSMALVYSHLVDALNAWTDIQEREDEAFLLDGGFPFGKSLDEVVAEVGAYNEALDKRLG